MGYREHISDGEYLAGLDDVARGLQAAVDAMCGGSAHGLADAGVFILSESVPLAPVDTGNLRGSGYVELDGERVARGDGKSGTVSTIGAVPEDATHAEIGFGAKYAADQHEQVNLNHPRGGEAKYLESVLVENYDRILELIATGVQNGLNGGGD